MPTQEFITTGKGGLPLWSKQGALLQPVVMESVGGGHWPCGQAVSKVDQAAVLGLDLSLFASSNRIAMVLKTSAMSLGAIYAISGHYRSTHAVAKPQSFCSNWGCFWS